MQGSGPRFFAAKPQPSPPLIEHRVFLLWDHSGRFHHSRTAISLRDCDTASCNATRGAQSAPFTTRSLTARFPHASYRSKRNCPRLGVHLPASLDVCESTYRTHLTVQPDTPLHRRQAGGATTSVLVSLHLYNITSRTELYERYPLYHIHHSTAQAFADTRNHSSCRSGSFKIPALPTKGKIRIVVSRSCSAS
jgi:hypothetical protein